MLQIKHYTLGLHTNHSFINLAKKGKRKKRQKLHCSIKYDNTSHDGRLLPLPAVVGWVAVFAGVCTFGGIFEPRALEPTAAVAFAAGS